MSTNQNYIDKSLRPKHLLRYGWTPNFSIKYPEDINLAITTEVDRSQISSVLQEIYYRFYDLGFIQDYGNQCVLMSSILRRILRIHKIPASMKQVVLHWQHETKGRKITIGGFNNYTPEGCIDSHVVVQTSGLILDFAASSIMEEYGSTMPRAFISSADEKFYDNWQNFGDLHGQASWIPSKPENPIIKHWRYNQKQLEIDITKEYFKVFQF